MSTVIENKIQYVTNASGEKTAVVVPIEEYEEMLEDLHDLAILAERKDEPVISHEQLNKELKSDAIL